MTVINVVVGTLIAWVLVRDDFRGKRLVDAVIDLPFALPTIVASIVLLALYGPQSPVGLHLFATQPAAHHRAAVRDAAVRRALGPAGAHGGRPRGRSRRRPRWAPSNWTIFRRIVLPALVPTLLSGAGLAFARALGEYGSVVLIGGGIPHDTEVSSQYIAKQVETDRADGRGRGVGRAAARRVRRARRCCGSWPSAACATR